MARGIIYIMETVVNGILKIGKTGSDNFESRMNYLESNGYRNVTGLKRKFAIEVDDYDEKEKLLDEIFSKSKVANTELYALDIDLVIKLLSSFEGNQIYPKEKTKEEVFDEAVKESKLKSDLQFVPDGEYYLERNINGFGKTKGIAIKEDGVFKVLKGSFCAPLKEGFISKARDNAIIVDNILMEDIICNSPSTAGEIIIGRSNNGWNEWKDKNGNKISTYRPK